MLSMKFPRTRRVKINGLSLQFYHWGNPRLPKLFLFHGWLDTGASFHFLAEHLLKHFHCIAPDLRGYGKSAHSPSPLGYFFYEHVADLHEIFHHFSPKQAVRVLAHSLGGAIAGIYAGGIPERVSHFINVEGFAFRHNPPERGPEKLKHWIENLHHQRFQVFKTLGHFAERLRKNNPRLPLERAKFLSRYLAKRVSGGYTMAADPKQKLAEPYVMVRPLIYAFWEQIQAKCLLVSAESSEMNQWVKAKNLKSEIQERMRHFPKGNRKILIPDCGHMIHHERPDLLAQEVLKFLK